MSDAETTIVYRTAKTVTMNYSHQLHGWAKTWAKIRRKPWKWQYTAQVKPGGKTINEDGTVSYDFALVGPLTKSP